MTISTDALKAMATHASADHEKEVLATLRIAYGIAPHMLTDRQDIALNAMCVLSFAEGTSVSFTAFIFANNWHKWR